MAKFKEGDFVVWAPPNKNISPIYCTVEKVLDLPAIEEPYYICFRRDVLINGKHLRETYEFWEHDLELVDMKGAYI